MNLTIMSNDEYQQMEEDEEDPIDDDQLNDYREMVDDLGTFPDKVKINSLSMVAEDHADSRHNAAAIYNVIRKRLIEANVDYKLPLVYVIDSILKNVKGNYIKVIEQDVKTWMPIVHQALSEDNGVKLKKVWNLWKDGCIFEESKWREMGSCFSAGAALVSQDSSTGGPGTNATLEQAGITHGKDGGLLLMPNLRNAMQYILDDLQSDVQDELEKVSLERLSTIDPDLLVKIKRTAEDSIRNGGGTSANAITISEVSQSEEDVLSFLVETRTPKTIEQSKAWEKLKLNHMKDANAIIASLQHLLRDGSSPEKRYTQQEALDGTAVLASAAVTAALLTNSLQQIQNEEKIAKSTISISTGGSDSRATATTGFVKVDKSLFTNDGLKKKNDAVVGVLYGVGLPFVSSSDGRRFATQLQLSNHLDALFRKGQLEKSIATTEERGWYVSDSTWNGEAKENEMGASIEESNETAATSTLEEDKDPSTFTVPADESRDRCVVCGINFKMFFDNDDGIYKYSNAKEIEVLNDEAALKESEEMLVHVTCWRALGSPQVLTPDLALVDTMQNT